MDLAIIQGGLSSIEVALSLVKQLKNAENSLQSAELELKIAELMTLLAEAKISLVDAQLYISELDQQVKALTQIGEIRTNFFDGVYVTIDDSGDPIDGPYCARCFDVDKKLIRPAPAREKGRGMAFCPECKNNYPLWKAEAFLKSKNEGN